MKNKFLHTLASMHEDSDRVTSSNSFRKHQPLYVHETSRTFGIFHKIISYTLIFSLICSNCVWAQGPLRIIEEDFEGPAGRTYVGKKVGFIDPGIVSGNLVHNIFDDFQLPSGSGVVFKSDSEAQAIFNRIYSKRPIHLSGVIQSDNDSPMVFANPGGVNLENPDFKHIPSLTLAAGGIAETGKGMAYGIDQEAVSLHNTLFEEESDLKALALIGRSIQLSQSVLGISEKIDLTTGQHLGVLNNKNTSEHPTAYVAEEADAASLDHSILIDPVTILRSKNLTFRSFDEGAPIYSLGLLESTNEDICIYGKGDIYLHNLVAARNLNIETTGRVFFGAQAWVGGEVNIKAQDIHIEKGLSSVGKAFLKASRHLNVHGNVSSEDDVSFKGKESLNLQGTIAAKGKVIAKSRGDIKQEGFLYSAGALEVKGKNFSKRGNILSEGDLSIATEKDLENRAGSISSLGSSTFSSQEGKIINRGEITSEETIGFNTLETLNDRLVENYGLVESQGILTTNREFFNKDQGIIKAKALSNPLALLTRNRGIVEVKDDLTLQTNAAVLRGTIKIQGKLEATGETLKIEGKVTAQKGSHLNLKSLTNKGTFVTLGSGLQGNVDIVINEGKMDFSALNANFKTTKNQENGAIRTKDYFILRGDHYENKGTVFTCGVHQATLTGTYEDSGIFYSPTLFLLKAGDVKYVNSHKSYLKDGVVSASANITVDEKVALHMPNHREKCFLQLSSQGSIQCRAEIKQSSNTAFPVLEYFNIFQEKSPVLAQDFAEELFSLSISSWKDIRTNLGSGVILQAAQNIDCQKTIIEPESGSVSLIAEGHCLTEDARIKSGYFKGNNAYLKSKDAILQNTILQSLFGEASVIVKDSLKLNNAHILGGERAEAKARSLKMEESAVRSSDGTSTIQVEKKAKFNDSVVQGKALAHIDAKAISAKGIKVESNDFSLLKVKKSAKIKGMTLSGQSTVLDVGEALTLSMASLEGVYNKVIAPHIKADSLKSQGTTVVEAKKDLQLQDLNAQGQFSALAPKMVLSRAIEGENLEFEADHLKNETHVHAEKNLRMKGQTLEQLGTTKSDGNSHIEATEHYIDTKGSQNEAAGTLALLAEKHNGFKGQQKADTAVLKLQDMNLLALLNQTEARVTQVHLKEGEITLDADLALKTNLQLWGKRLENKAKLTGNEFIAHMETTILNQGSMNFHVKAFLKAKQGIKNTGDVSADEGLGFETEGVFTHKGNVTSEHGLLSVKAGRIDADAEVHTYHETASPNSYTTISTRKAGFVIPSFSGKNVRLESDSIINARGTQFTAQENMDLIAKEKIHINAIAYAEGDQETTVNLSHNLTLKVTTDPRNKYLQTSMQAGNNIRTTTPGKLDGRGLKAHTAHKGGLIVLQADKGVDLSSLAAVSVVERWNYNTGLFGQNNHRGFREDAEFYRSDLTSQGGGIYILAKEGGITARGTSFQAQDEIRMDARDNVDLGALKVTVRNESRDETGLGGTLGSIDEKSGSTERFRQMQALSNKKIGIFSRNGTIEGEAPFMRAPEIELDGEKGILFKPLEIHSQEDTHHYENNLNLNPTNIEFEHKEKHTQTKSMQQMAGVLQTDHLKVRTGQGAKASLTVDAFGLTQEAADITADTDGLVFAGIKNTYDSTIDAWSVKVSVDVNMTPGGSFDVSHDELRKTNYGATVLKFATFHNKRKGATLHVEGGAQTSINEATGEDMEAVVDRKAQNRTAQEGYSFGASLSSTGGSVHASAKGGEKVSEDQLTSLHIKKQTNKVNRKDVEHETKDTRWGIGGGVSVDQNGKVSANVNAQVGDKKVGFDIPTTQEQLNKLNPVESFKSMEIPKDLDSLGKATQSAVNLNQKVNDLGIDTGDVGKSIKTAHQVTQTVTQAKASLDQIQGTLHADSVLQGFDQAHDALTQLNTTAQMAGLNTGPVGDFIQTTQSIKQTAKNAKAFEEKIEKNIDKLKLPSVSEETISNLKVKYDDLLPVVQAGINDNLENASDKNLIEKKAYKSVSRGPASQQLASLSIGTEVVKKVIKKTISKEELRNDGLQLIGNNFTQSLENDAIKSLGGLEDMRDAAILSGVICLPTIETPPLYVACVLEGTSILTATGLSVSPIEIGVSAGVTAIRQGTEGLEEWCAEKGQTIENELNQWMGQTNGGPFSK